MNMAKLKQRIYFNAALSFHPFTLSHLVLSVEILWWLVSLRLA